MGLFSFIGGILGGNSVKKGLDKAANAQNESSTAQINRLGSFLDTTTENYDPYMLLGKNSVQAYADLMGLGGSAGSTNWTRYLEANPDVAAGYANADKGRFRTPEEYAQWHYDNFGRTEGRDVSGYTDGAVSAGDAQSRAIAALERTPLFNSLISNGEDAILANASATGGLRGGNNIDRLTRFRADTLSNVIQNQLQGYQGGINTGMNATGNVAQVGMGVTGAQNSATQAATDMNVQRIMGKAGINNRNWQNAGGMLDDAMSAALGGGSFKSIAKSLF